MAETEDDLRRLDQSLAPACEMETHAAGRAGCESDKPASFIIEAIHLPEGHPNKYRLVCIGYAIRFRTQQMTIIHCPHCHGSLPLSELFHLQPI